MTEKVAVVRGCNTARYYKENPGEEMTASLAGSIHPDSGANTDADSVTSARLSSTLRLQKIEPYMQRFGATVGTMPESPANKVVVLLELLEVFMDIFQESSATNMSRSFRNQLEHH